MQKILFRISAKVVLIIFAALTVYKTDAKAMKPDEEIVREVRLAHPHSGFKPAPQRVVVGEIWYNDGGGGTLGQFQYDTIDTPTCQEPGCGWFHPNRIPRFESEHIELEIRHQGLRDVLNIPPAEPSHCICPKYRERVMPLILAAIALEREKQPTRRASERDSAARATAEAASNFHHQVVTSIKCPVYVTLEPLGGIKRIGEAIEEAIWGDARAVHAVAYIHWPDGIYRYEFNKRGQAFVTPVQAIPTEPGKKINAVYIANIGHESRGMVDDFIHGYIRRYNARNDNCRTFVDEFLCHFVHQERWYMEDQPWHSSSPLEWIHRMRRERSAIPNENLRPLPTMLPEARAPFILVWHQDDFHHTVFQDQPQAIQRYNNIDFQWSRAMISAANGNIVGKHSIQGWGEKCEEEARRLMAAFHASAARQAE